MSQKKAPGKTDGKKDRKPARKIQVKDLDTDKKKDPRGGVTCGFIKSIDGGGCAAE